MYILRIAEAEGKVFAMNTVITYKVYGERAEKAVEEVSSELARLENKLSRFIPDSEVSLINKNSGIKNVHISHETFEILSCAVLLSRISQGLFDITVTPLVDLWDYQHSCQVPSDIKIRDALSLVDFHGLEMNSKDGVVGLPKSGQSIDLGGIGKGFTSNRCIQIFKQFDVTSAYMNIGGNVSTLGNKPDDTSWNVGIRHPRRIGCLMGAVKVTGKAVVTSGDYERYFVDLDGNRWHHILNPTTGYPAEAGLISVTVVDDSAMIADGLSTAIFIAGTNKGLEYLAQFPGAEAIIMDKNLNIFVTGSLEGWYEPARGMKCTFI